MKKFARPILWTVFIIYCLILVYVLFLSRGTRVGFTFAEYMRLREIVGASAQSESKEAAKEGSASKQDYEQKKRENAQKRAFEKKIERAKVRIEELEAESVKLDEELFGEAASNYVRAAEIDKRKAEIETELLELYELVM